MTQARVVVTSEIRGVGFAHQFTGTIYPICDELLQGSISYERFKSGLPHQNADHHPIACPGQPARNGILPVSQIFLLKSVIRQDSYPFTQV